MSRIGREPIEIPEAVDVQVKENTLTVKGVLGELSTNLVKDIEVTKSENFLTLQPQATDIYTKKMWGTYRSLLNNLIVGVSKGYTKELEIQGVGYRAQVQGEKLQLTLGFSHDINFQIPEGIKITCADQTHITISGIDKQKVGQTAAKIREFKPPEPYKGKGIRYSDEYVVRKEGKKK